MKDTFRAIQFAFAALIVFAILAWFIHHGVSNSTQNTHKQHENHKYDQVENT